MSATSSGLPPVFPFTAVIGQYSLKKALLLAVIEPRLGGVLISGPRGVAKTTLARALTAILPDEESPFINLPLGCSVAQLTGSLDIDHALSERKVRFRPGLLAKAHHGILYVDEVNLLPDVLVDQLLDAAASGRHYVEREGISHVHPADFVLIGSMNPEEGELRPQLCDRFGLALHLEGTLSCEERVAIVRARRQYDDDPETFCQRHAAAMAELKSQLAHARQRLASVYLPEQLEYTIAERCAAAQVEGVRADVAWQRAATAHASWHQRSTVTEEDINAVEELVLFHRRLSTPTPPTPSPPTSPTFMPPPAFPPTDKASGPADNAPQESAHNITAPQGHVGESSQHATAFKLPESEGDIAPLLPLSAPKRSSGVDFNPRGIGRSPHGVREGQGSHPSDDIDWEASLSFPENHSDDGLKKVSFHTYRSGINDAVLIMLDSSASQCHPDTFNHTRQVVQQLIANAQQHNRYVALLYFQGQNVKWLLRGRERIRNVTRLLDTLSPSGGTPLDHALQEGRRWVARWQRKFPAAQIDSWLITDGRCTWQPTPTWPSPLTVIDSEASDRPLGRSRQLATVLGGNWVDSATLRQQAS